MERKKLNFNAPLLSVRRRINSGHQSKRVRRKHIENPLPNNREQSVPAPQPDPELTEATSKTLAVPFCWEQAPGKPRGENGGEVHRYENMLRLGRKPNSRSQSNDITPFKDHGALLDSLVERMYAKGEFDAERRDYSYSEEEGLDDAFMMRRSIRELKAGSIRESKAVVVVTEEPKLVKNKSVAVERRHYYYSEYADDAAIEYDEHEVTSYQHKRPHKFWKLFHRLRAKSSSEGPKIRNLEASPSLINGPGRKTGNTLLGRSRSQSRKAYSGPLGKQPSDSTSQQRFHSGALSGELFKVGKRNISNQLSHSRSATASPVRNFASSSHSSDRTRFLGVPRELENFKGGYHHHDIPTRNMHTGASNSPIDVVEKTVYVDSVNYVKTPSLDSFPSKTKAVIETLSHVKPPEELKGISERRKGSKNMNQERINQQQGLKELEIVHRNENISRSSKESSYPPLPKSPTESWLWRTLPSVSPRSNIDNIDKSPRAATNPAIRREVTVKSCNENLCNNSYYFEELVPHGSHLW
ncbi:unnamed protein product [Cuscuta epithymum]|uniref:DUF3741 domain-containing protein n=1 Tax=Cuscuta epithymum TaxID=186058 RepID=A0AAV0E0J5_9ASTE|nr:unnamed protein product [Cuscuta epithymum]